MMKKQNKKRGFTIVELVIVVTVIAILSAVLIPTFAGVIKRSKMSADQQATRNMNMALVGAEIADLEDAIDVLDEAGYNAEDTLVPVSKNHAFYWDNANKTVVLVNTKNNTVVYPENYKASFSDDWADLKNDGYKYVDITASNEDVLTKALKAGNEKITLSSNVEIKGQVSLAENANITLNLNGNTLKASSTNRPFKMEGATTLTINAENSEVLNGYHGLVDIRPNANATVTLNGGTYNADKDSVNGAFIKVREGATANITLNNVTYIDETNENYVVNSDMAFANLTVNGGNYKAKAGFQATASSTFTNVTIEATESYCVEVAMESTENNSVITGCTLKAPAAEWACLVVSGGASLEVSNCTIEATYAYAVLPSGGTIVATGNDNNTYNTYTMDEGAVASLTIDGVKKI